MGDSSEVGARLGGERDDERRKAFEELPSSFVVWERKWDEGATKGKQ